jgi:hypothetical protein
MNELETKGLGGKRHMSNNGTIHLTPEKAGMELGLLGGLCRALAFVPSSMGRAVFFFGGGTFQSMGLSWSGITGVLRSFIQGRLAPYEMAGIGQIPYCIFLLIHFTLP